MTTPSVAFPKFKITLNGAVVLEIILNVFFEVLIFIGFSHEI